MPSPLNVPPFNPTAAPAVNPEQGWVFDDEVAGVAGGGEVAQRAADDGAVAAHGDVELIGAGRQTGTGDLARHLELSGRDLFGEQAAGAEVEVGEQAAGRLVTGAGQIDRGL